MGYDCSKPMEVKPISSFIHDPCEPAEANNKETYDIQSVTQFQIVNMRLEGNFLGLDAKGIFRNLHVTAVTQITLVLCPKKPSSGDPRSWPKMNAEHYKWDSFVPETVRPTVLPKTPEGKLVISLL